MTRTQEMARWSASLKYDQIPQSVKDRAKLQILSVVASAHAGGISPASKKLLAAVRRWDAGGRSPVISTGESLSLHGALFANTALSMAHDYDDYLFLGHTGHSAVFTSMLVALKEHKSIEEMIAAQVAANEIGGRLGAACLIGPQNGQVWTHIHLVEAAVAASKLYGLDPQATAHAIAISLYQPNFALFPGFMGPDTKILSAAQTSLGGLMAADLAREGFTGPLDVIENRQGFLNQFTFAPLEFMLSGYGKSWVMESIAYKLVPGCAYIDTSVDAMNMIIEQFKKRTGNDLAPRDVREIVVKASMLTTEMDHLSKSHVDQGELNPIAINFSIAANLAIMILAGGLRVDRLDPDWLELHKEDIMSLVRRTKLEHDWSMSMAVTEAFRKVIDLKKVVDHVGLTTLIAAQRKVSKHHGSEVNFGIKELSEIRKASNEQGTDYLKGFLGGMIKGILGPKRRVGQEGPPDLSESDFSKFRMPFAAEVTLKTTDWKDYTARQDIPWGAPGQPWEDTVSRVKAKFHREAHRNLGEDQIEWVLGKLEKLETVHSVQELVNHLAPVAGKGKPKKPEHEPRPVKTPAIIFESEKPAEPKHVAKPEPKSAPKPTLKPTPPAPKPAPRTAPIDDSDLPPVNIEPIRKPAHPPREKPQPRPMNDLPPISMMPQRRPESHKPPVEKPVEKRPVERRPVEKKAVETKVDEKKSFGVSMRHAKPGEKTPRPPKGAKRRHSRRP